MKGLRLEPIEAHFCSLEKKKQKWNLKVKALCYKDKKVSILPKLRMLSNLLTRGSAMPREETKFILVMNLFRLKSFL